MNSTETDFSAKNRDLLLFYDNFVEFHDHCAFLCEAAATLVGENEPFDASTIAGIRRYCFWLKGRAEDLKGELNQIRESALSRRNEGADS